MTIRLYIPGGAGFLKDQQYVLCLEILTGDV